MKNNTTSVKRILTIIAIVACFMLALTSVGCDKDDEAHAKTKLNAEQILANMQTAVADADKPPKFERSDLKDGTPRWLSQTDEYLFEVSPNSVIAVFEVVTDNKEAVAAVFMGCLRVCMAVFGKEDKEVMQKMAKLLKDSGETLKASKATHKGYSLELSFPKEGLLMFSVKP